MTNAYTIRTRVPESIFGTSRVPQFALTPESRVIPRIAIVAIVLSLHALALWGLQAGFANHRSQRVVPVTVEAAMIIADEPEPQPAPPAPEPPKAQAAKPQAAPRPARTVAKDTRPAAPPPQADEASKPSPEVVDDPANAMETSSQPSAESSRADLPASTTSPDPMPVSGEPTDAAPAIVELPTENANYLHNPKPRYPSMSKRLGEQGIVEIRVFIDVSGQASQASIVKSSGFFRLDEAGLQAASSWRYVPGRRGGVPEAMWYVVPIRFELDP